MSNMLKTTVGRLGAVAGGLVIAAAVWVGLGSSLRAAPPVPDPVTCLPTCTVDGRSLVSAGDDPTTLSAQEITIGLSFTAAAGPNGNFELFDGDRDQTNWDVLFNCGNGCPGNGALAPQLIVELFADPAGIGGSGSPLATWTPGEAPSGIEMGTFPVTNNGWNGVTFSHDASAINGSDYLYSVHIRPFMPETDKGWNAFKIRAAGTTVLLGNQVVGFIGAMNVPNDVDTIYPNGIGNPGSPYDGTWVFKTRLPAFLGDVTVYDGDMDFGAPNCAYNDTDDSDSSGVPPFALGSAAVAEGIAVANAPAACSPPGVGNRTGTPAEDNSANAFRRVPTIIPNGIAYQLKAPGSPANPNGQVFINQNPSGNKEWEQFKIQLVQQGDVTNGACPEGGYPADVNKGYAASDCRTTDLPGGLWEIQLDGMDLSNLNFWFFSFKVEVLPTEYSIGRLVWYDANENGLQDLCSGVPCAPELGIAGVAYTVYDAPVGSGGQVVRTGVTDANGEFLEEQLPAGNYTVVVDAANFGAGQPLNGLTSTTGGETEDGVEVGLPVCIDTNNPAGCGQPSYAEAIFGYVEHSTNCIVQPAGGGEPFEGAIHQIIPNPPGSPAGAITIRTTLNAPRFVDNTYGTNAIGWPSGHTFGNLTGSDKLQLALYDTSGVKKLEFAMDYISASATPGQGGYDTLGVTGGDGSMILGAASNIVDVDTSLAVNFRDPVMTPKLTVNSPATNASYAPPAAPYTNWIFEVYYDVTFKTDLFGGPSGFGAVKVAGVHASPSKTGSNTEICLYEGDPGLAVADNYQTTKNTPLVIAAPGVLGNDTDPFNLPLTAVIVTPPAANRGTLNLNANGGFTFTPFNNFTGDATFSYKTYNGTSYSNTVQDKVKVVK
jgi:hypothetical protein